MSQENSNNAFTELLIELTSIQEDDQLEKLGGNSTFKCTCDKEDSAIKIFEIKNTDDYDDYKNGMSRFLKIVTYMSSLRHTTICELRGWNVIGIYNINGQLINYDNSDLQFDPFIVTKLYTGSLESEFNNITNWDATQLSIVIYGMLRGFRHMNSFNLVFSNIKKEKILLSCEDNVLYPAINDFDNVPEAKVSQQLNSFGGLLSTFKAKDINRFEELIKKLKDGKDQFPDFHMATLFMEYDIVPDLIKDKLLDQKLFNDYKKEIDEVERKQFVDTKNKVDIDSLKNALEKCKGNRFIIARKVVELALGRNSLAAFRAAISYYSGETLPKDLVLCIAFLRFALKHDDNPVPKFFMNSLISIRDRASQDSKGEVVCDETSLFYRGAFAESLALEINPEKRFQSMDQNSTNEEGSIDINELEKNINEAISCYKQSLEIKPMPVVMGRLGALLTKYSTNPEGNGPKLLKMASDANDLYGMVNYGLYLLKHDKSDEAEKIFLKLYKQNYIDAAFTLGKIYKCKNDHVNAKKYFEIALKDFGEDEAKKYLESEQ
ncbi:hypothetical protein M9Y10_038100 [Tritrichomonas musculus]|uniref:Protein kinase domain-containing protein n=1 Tax=Tritrichomonas musculus TaxID=1915356 RepID=A0ABR2K7M4_9EUKA